MRLFERDTRRLLAFRSTEGKARPSSRGVERAAWEAPALTAPEEGKTEAAEAERFSDILERESRRFGRTLE